MFHAYANHTENIAHEKETIDDFEATAVSWMKNTSLFDEPEKKEMLSLLNNGVPTSEKEEKPATRNTKLEEEKKEPAAQKKEKTAPNTVDDFEMDGDELKKYRGVDAEVTIPDFVKKIGHRAFQSNNIIRKVNIGKSIDPCMFSSFDSCSNLETAVFDNGVTYLSFVFRNCTALKHVELPRSLLYLGYCTFENCESLDQVELHEGLKVINLSAFNGCKALSEIIVPYSVERIVGKIILPEHDIITLKVYKGSPAEKIVRDLSADESFRKAFSFEIINEAPSEKPFVHEYVLEEKAFETEGDVLKSYRGISETVTVPEGIKEIAKSAFSSNVFVKKVILPDGLTKIEESAFLQCHFLEEIDIPDTVKSIGERAFSDCTGLTEIKIPDKIKVLHKWLFDGCVSLTKVILPSKLTKINADCFCECKSLQTIELPGTLTTIGSSSFENCSSLQTIELPDSLTTIEYAAFSKSGLTSISIPSSVKTIKEMSFSKCSLLKDVYLQRETVLSTEGNLQFEWDPFYGSESVCIHVFKNSPAEQWVKKANHKFVIEYTPEQKAELERKERERKEEEARLLQEKARQEAEAKRLAKERMQKLAALNAEKESLLKTSEENKGLFGEKARRRKAAAARVAQINDEILNLEKTI